MPKTTVFSGERDVPEMHPVWGDVGPVTALGLAQAQLAAARAELQDVQEKLHKARRVATVVAAELDLLKVQLESH